MSTGNAQPVSISSSSSSSGQQITIFLNPAAQQTSNEHAQIHQSNDHHQLTPPKIGTTGGDTYQIAPMQPVSSADLQPQTHFIHVTNHNTITTANSAAIAAGATNINAPNINAISTTSTTTSDQNQNLNSQERDSRSTQHDQYDHNSPSATRFKWTEEKSQVAMNLVKYGCKPKLISVAVGCSLRTAQKFAETVTPKIEGESFKTYQIKRRGRKSKDVNQRLNLIREALSIDSHRTQVEIAADLKVSNTTVCRDLKRLGASWKAKKNGNVSLNASSASSTLENNNANELPADTKQQETSTPSRQITTRKTRQSNSKSQNNTNDDNGKDVTTKTRRQQKRNNKTNDNAPQQVNSSNSNPDNGQDSLTTSSNNNNVQQ